MNIIRVILVCLLIAIARDATAQSGPTLTPIAGGLFRFQSGGQASVVYVTQDAVLVADPLDLSAGQWLRGELAARFPGRPVSFVVYTSDVFERIAGAVAFPGATVVAHRNANTSL